MNQVIRVLVVDDSAYVRKVVSQMLSRSPFLEVVGTARDGREALEKVAELRPDVVTLDLMMPEMDGVAFIREQMARRPLPIVVVSIASESNELVLMALEAGALDAIQKPTALATEKILEISDDLIEKVKAAAAAAADRLRLTPAPVLAVAPSRAPRGAVDVVVIGISTGGPQALRYLIPQFPADFSVPIALVLHMPVGYTEMYAKKLDEISRLTIREAREGDPVVPGLVLVAPAGRHLSFVRLDGDQVVAHLDARPFDTPHRPAVDVLFRSAAEVYGKRSLGVVMTGMGSDGKEGASWIKAKDGLIFTESEESCVIYGMPRSVVEAGLSDKRLSLDQMAEAILDVV